MGTKTIRISEKLHAELERTKELTGINYNRLISFMLDSWLIEQGIFYEIHKEEGTHDSSDRQGKEGSTEKTGEVTKGLR